MFYVPRRFVGEGRGRERERERKTAEISLNMEPRNSSKNQEYGITNHYNKNLKKVLNYSPCKICGPVGTDLDQ